MPELNAPGWVAAAVRQGLSATAALKVFRDNGGSIRDQVWRNLYAEQSAATDRMLGEMTAPLHAIPSAQEILPMTTKRREGFLQTVDVLVRMKGTNTVTTKPFMMSTSTLMSRGDAVNQALTTMQNAVDDERYEEVVLGGVYTGTRVMTVGDIA